jgi:hypothetical protein
VCIQPPVHSPTTTGDEEDALREQYACEFRESPLMSSWHDLERPPKRTKTSAIAAANRVLSGESARGDEAYFDVDEYTLSLWYHHKINHTLYDLAHQFTNVIKHIFNWMKNTTSDKKLKFTTAVRAFETKYMGRFPDLRENSESNNPQGLKYPKPPWVARNQAEIDSLPSLCKCPSKWSAYRKMFAHLGFAKSSETLLFAGDVGAYTLRHVDMDPVYRDLFIEVLRLIERCGHVVCTLQYRTGVHISRMTCRYSYSILSSGACVRSAPPATGTTCVSACLSS